MRRKWSNIGQLDYFTGEQASRSRTNCHRSARCICPLSALCICTLAACVRLLHLPALCTCSFAASVRSLHICPLAAHLPARCISPAAEVWIDGRVADQWGDGGSVGPLQINGYGVVQISVARVDHSNGRCRISGAAWISGAVRISGAV